VTRGAQVHHYRTKDDLVTAAVRHLAGKSAEFGWSEFARAIDSADVVGSLLDSLWEMHKGPIFTATVELWVAARTDDELRQHVFSVEPALMSSLREIAEEGEGRLDLDVVDQDLLDAIYTAMDAMRGLVISTWHLPPRQRNARWRRARERLRLIFPADAKVVAAVAAARPAAGG
jgi:AcrR family transcriptional regulator